MLRAHCTYEMRIPTHYYADVELRIMRTQDAYPRPYART